jgi:hypothetical protein
MLVTAISLVLAGSSAVATAQFTAGPIKMKPSEIRAYNAKLTRDHPNYIRCDRVEETGSLVKKSTVCRTNEEWNRIETANNEGARDMARDMQKGWSNGG